MPETKQLSEQAQSEYLYDLLQRIQERPGLYLGRTSITRLCMLLRGYSMARREMGLPMTVQEQEFDGFQSWVQQRFNVTTTQSWESVLLFHSTDEKTAFELFFKLFEQFRQI